MNNPHDMPKHIAAGVEEAVRRYPDDPMRALTWLLFNESNLPRSRADFLLKKLTAQPAEAPKPPATDYDLTCVHAALATPLFLLTKPTYDHAREVAMKHGITAADLLDYRIRRVPR